MFTGLFSLCIRYIQSEIESLVTHGANGGECWGAYNYATETGYGAGLVESCVHSGSNDYSEGNTVWYNYALASAGTISNKSANDTAGNLNTAIQNICPKGWSLPFIKQIDTNRDVANFNPVLGGHYNSGALYVESTRGYWWGAEAWNGARRHFLYYNNSSLNSATDIRTLGTYIRCVSEEKTVTDLTYMQDMTLKIAPALSLCI